MVSWMSERWWCSGGGIFTLDSLYFNADDDIVVNVLANRIVILSGVPSIPRGAT